MEPAVCHRRQVLHQVVSGSSGSWDRSHELGPRTVLGSEEAFPPHLTIYLGGEQTKDKWPYTLVSHVVDSGTGRGSTP